MSEPKFKIGDKVLLLMGVDIYTTENADEKPDYNYPVFTIEKGELFTIQNISIEHGLVTYLIEIVTTLEGQFDVWVLEDSLRKI